LPVHFGPQSNLVWSVEVPPGHSSPCIWQDLVFITGLEQNKFATFCFHRADGRQLWRAEVVLDRVEKGTGGSAAPTPVTDGSRVYVYSGAFGLLCYDFGGREIWRKPMPTPVTQHGTGASPVLAGQTLLVSRDQDVDSHLLAVDARNGRTLWRVERAEFRRGFSTPLPWPLEKPELAILPGTLRMLAYELRDGSVRWSVSGLPNEMVSSPIAGEGLIFTAGWTPGAGTSRLPKFDDLLAQGDANKDGQLTREELPAGTAKRDFNYVDADKDGFLTRAEWEPIKAIYEKSENALLAVRPGGKGDITETHVAWKQTRGLPYVPTPLCYQGRLYLVKNGGLVSCFDAQTGRVHFLEERLGALGDYYASPVAAGGKILFISQPGLAVVIKAGDSLEVLARNPLGEKTMATPAVIGTRLYLRTLSRLYCFGTP